MGGFAEGDAIQVDVRSHDSDLCPVSTLPNDAPACSRRQSRAALTQCPTLPELDASHIRNVLCNQEIFLADTCTQYDPASLQYMLNFFRDIAHTMPSEPSAIQDGDGVVPLDPSARDDSSKRAGVIVLREDLDFYVIPPKQDISQAEMMEIKRAAAKALLRQDGIFSGLKRSDEPGTTEAHLIEMLTAG